MSSVSEKISFLLSRDGEVEGMERHMWGLNILEGPFNDIFFNVVNRIADQFCSCEAWLMLVVHYHKTGHITVESQRWKEKPCEGNTDWEGGEEGRGEGAGGETMWERGWGWHRLPVSHLQFPPLPVIRGAAKRACLPVPSSKLPFWSQNIARVDDHLQLHVCPIWSCSLFATCRLRG